MIVIVVISFPTNIGFCRCSQECSDGELLEYSSGAALHFRVRDKGKGIVYGSNVHVVVV